MAAQSEIGTWQQIAAWEKSIAGERNIAPPPPKLKSVKRTENPGEDSTERVKPPSLRP
jgi:hypothetical protein